MNIHSDCNCQLGFQLFIFQNHRCSLFTNIPTFVYVNLFISKRRKFATSLFWSGFCTISAIDFYECVHVCFPWDCQCVLTSNWTGTEMMVAFFAHFLARKRTISNLHNEIHNSSPLVQPALLQHVGNEIVVCHAVLLQLQLNSNSRQSFFRLLL